MGGGDLNLKKSWHPHTMKNMERVWKAEQKDTEEKKRIAELQREIVAERSKEELQKFAEDMGVVKKKDEVKLEWMYKGPSQSINREDYLLGKAVDKNFEKHNNELSGDFVEEESLPDALRQARSSMFSEQVDVARKLHEDPLMAIRQRAVEKAKQLYNNPVKMKLIQKMAAVKSSDDKMHKTDKKKKKKKEKKSSKSDEKMLDALLTQKLRTALKDRDLLQKLKEKAHESSSGSSDSDKSSESDDDSVSKRHKKQSNDHESVQREHMAHINKSETGKQESPIRSKDYKSWKYFHDGYKSRESKRYSRSPNFKYHRNSLNQSLSSRTSRSRSRDRHNISKKTHGFPSQKASTSRPPRSSSKERQIIKENSPSFGKAIYEKNRRNVRRDEGSDSSYVDSDTDTASSKKRRMFGLMMADGSRPVIKEKPLLKDVKKQQSLEPTKPLHQRREKLKLTNEEKEKRRTEMLENACWRDKEREANVKQYRMEEANEKKQLLENFDTDFSMKQLSKVSSQYSVEGRIKSKLNSIQRSKVAMDQNFARR